MEKIEFLPVFFAPLVAIVVLIFEVFLFSLDKLAEPTHQKSQALAEKCARGKALALTTWINRFWGCGQLSKRLSAYAYSTYKELQHLSENQGIILDEVVGRIEKFRESFVRETKVVSLIYCTVVICYLLLRYVVFAQLPLSGDSINSGASLAV